jgi:hypothetical protein
MPRRARLKLPGVPVHLIQRGNNRQACYFGEESRYGWANALSAQHSQKDARLIHLFRPHQTLTCSHIFSRDFAMIEFISSNVGLIKR